MIADGGAVINLFDKINQHAMAWVKDMMAELRTEDPHKALHALRAGLQALRDLLSVDGAAQLSAQLPLLLRGMFFEGWDPSDSPMRFRQSGDYLPLVREKLAAHVDATPDDVVVALFRVMSRHVSGGELTKVMLSLPDELVAMAQGPGPRGA
jgi:uncharacterized protein (DUF2267 family)